MAKAMCTVTLGGKSVELWYGTAAAKRLENLLGRSLMTLEDAQDEIGLTFLTQVIRSGFAHLTTEPTEAEIDAMLDGLDAETEAAPPSAHATEAEAAANVIERRAEGQNPKVIPPEKEGHAWRVVDEPPPPTGETFTTLTKKVLAAFTEGMPAAKKKRKKPEAPANPTP